MSNLVKKSAEGSLKSPQGIVSDKPINNNIKEKLNLHVKRRIQESASDTSLNNNNNNTNNNNNNNNEVKVRKQYTKRTDKPNNTTLGRRTKRAKLKQSPSSSSTVSRNDTEGIGSVTSTASIASAGDDEGSRDGNSQNLDLHSPKEKERCPDLLGLVLNAKKRALFQNPEVVKFLQNIMDVLRQ